MKIKKGKGTTKYGPGVEIRLTSEDAGRAIYAYVVAKGVHIEGSSTIIVNDTTIESAHIYVDPSGFVIDKDGTKHEGRG